MNIKFKPTGIIFNLPEDICKDLISSDRANYELIKEVKKPPEKNPAAPKKNTTSKANQKAKTIEIKGEANKKPAESEQQ